MTCPHCVGADHFFGNRAARFDLWRYRRTGPLTTTGLLLDALRKRRPEPGFTLLDIGSGVGAIQHELLDDGAARAVSVDASRAYLAAALHEGERRGHADRMEQHIGDFVELADEIPDADVVTLDRVVCCYPDMPALVAASARHARTLYGLVVPREVWWVRVGVRLMNVWQRLLRTDFRVYVHPLGAIQAAVESEGLKRVEAGRTLNWQVMLFERRAAHA